MYVSYNKLQNMFLDFSEKSNHNKYVSIFIQLINILLVKSK